MAQTPKRKVARKDAKTKTMPGARATRRKDPDHLPLGGNGGLVGDPPPVPPVPPLVPDCTPDQKATLSALADLIRGGTTFSLIQVIRSDGAGWAALIPFTTHEGAVMTGSLVQGPYWSNTP